MDTAVGPVLAAQRVPAAGRGEDGQVRGRHAAAGRPDRGRVPPGGVPAVPARRPLPQPARLHHRRHGRGPGHPEQARRRDSPPPPPRPPRKAPARRKTPPKQNPTTPSSSSPPVPGPPRNATGPAPTRSAPNSTPGA